MQKYIGVKVLEAQEMTLGEYNTERGLESSEKNDPKAPGYFVVYPDGYKSWSPKEAFESAYLALEGDGSRITKPVIKAFMGEVTDQQIDEKTTLVTAKTLSGFVQHEVSSCVDPKNYDHTIGVECATGRIEDALWKCLAFVLQWGRFGLKTV